MPGNWITNRLILIRFFVVLVKQLVYSSIVAHIPQDCNSLK